MRNSNIDPTTTVRTATEPTWLTQPEMARRLRVHPLTLARLADAGRIPRARVGRSVRYPAERVEQALTRP